MPVLTLRRKHDRLQNSKKMKNVKVGMTVGLFALATVAANAQTINGTVRGKYEYQTEEQEGRFEVRTARVSVSGKLTDLVSYKAEIDLCDEGSIKMLDAYARLHPLENFQFTLGQMRVPFTIDAHRSPHEQYFANRSFIAKQVGNVRDVGATLGYTIPFQKDVAHPMTLQLQAGLYNGSGLTNQKNFWTKSVNFSSKAELKAPIESLYGASGPNKFRGICAEASAQKIRPDDITVMMYDAALYYQDARWHVEGEYLLKTYAHDAFDNVNAVDAFVSYSVPVKAKMLKVVMPLVRYDYMDDHSDGKRDSETGKLSIDDYRRSRITAGVTLRLLSPLQTDLRLNYEKYFYEDGAVPAVSERDKVVAELVVRF